MGQLTACGRVGLPREEVQGGSYRGSYRLGGLVAPLIAADSSRAGDASRSANAPADDVDSPCARVVELAA